MQHVIDAASTGSLYALIALGIALVFGVMHLVNFAHGELVTIGGYTVLAVSGLPWPFVVLIVVAAVAVAALLMERVAFRPVRGASPTTMLVTSFAVSILIQNIIVLIEGRRAKGVPFGGRLAQPVIIGGNRIALVSVVSVCVAIVLVSGLALFLKRTWIGIAMRGAAEDFTMARLLGVEANSVIATAFVLSGILAAAASLLLVSATGTLTPDMGLQPVLIGFVATVIGGIGSLAGAAVGGFLLGSVSVALQEALPLSARGWRDAFVFGTVILILLIRPGGIFSTSALEERV